MFDIIRFTPTWVWALLTALIALGAVQLRTRSVTRARLLILPLVLIALGLWSTASSFTSPLPALLAWGTALGVASWFGRRLPRPPGARWDAATQRLHLPGSVVPLIVILLIFVLRYGASVELALHPAWRGALDVALPLAATYGIVSGLLLGRALGLVDLGRATIGDDARLRAA